MDVSEMNTLHFDIYPYDSTTNIGLEFQTDSGNISYTISGLVLDEWNSIDISLSDFVNGDLFGSVTDYNWLVLNGGTGSVAGTIGENIIIDNVYFYNNGIEEEEQEEVVALSIFSDDEDSITINSYNQFWGGQTTTGGLVVESSGNNIIEYAALNYVGANISGNDIDLSSASYVSMDIQPVGTANDVTFEFETTGGTKCVYTVPAGDLTADSWTTIEISVSSFSNSTDLLSNDLFWFITVGTGTVQIDNIIFYE